MTTTVQQSISLFFRQGSSDKEYHAQLEPKGSGFVVNFQYGRRGATLQSGTKTQEPVELDKAQKIYDKLVKSKMSEGYTQGEAGTPFVASDKEERVSGRIPQLLNPIREDELEKYFADDDWFMQEKMDGKHMILEGGNKVQAINRKGLYVGFPKPWEEALLVLQDVRGTELVLDGEAVGDVYHAFDILKDGKDTTNLGARDRHDILMEVLQPRHSLIVLVPRSEGEVGKRGLAAQIRGRRGEGWVFKRANAPYRPGKAASKGDYLKLKLWADNDLVVLKVNAKRSVQLGAYSRDRAIPVGNCTVFPNYTMPHVGDIVKVQYLYAYPDGGSLYQPQYLGRREDKDAADRYSDLKFKAGSGEDAEAA